MKWKREIAWRSREGNDIFCKRCRCCCSVGWRDEYKDRKVVENWHHFYYFIDASQLVCLKSQFIAICYNPSTIYIHIYVCILLHKDHNFEFCTTHTYTYMHINILVHTLQSYWTIFHWKFSNTYTHTFLNSLHSMVSLQHKLFKLWMFYNKETTFQFYV